MSSALTLARPYARAAFALARDNGCLPLWTDSLGFAAQLALEPRVQSLLGHPALTVDDAVAFRMPAVAEAQASSHP